MTSITQIKTILNNTVNDIRCYVYREFRLTMSSAAAGNVHGGLRSLGIGLIAAYILFMFVSWVIPQCLWCHRPFCCYYSLDTISDKSIGSFNITQTTNNVISIKKGDLSLFDIEFVKDDAQLRAVLKVKGKKIEWWKTNNIADSNVVFNVEHPGYYGWAITEISYPTSTAALVSWIRQYGKDDKMWIWAPPATELPATEPPTGKTSNPLAGVNDADIKLLCGELEYILDYCCRFNKKNDGLLFCIRSLNGWCQFLCVALFLSTGFCLCARWYVFRRPQIEDKNKQTAKNDTVEESAIMDTHASTRTIRSPSPEEITHARLETEYNRSADKEKEFCLKWNGTESPQWFVYRNGLAFFLDQKEEKHLSLAEIANAGKDMLATSRLYVHWMLDAIPALGFLGTVVGISQTMMRTGGILTDELGKQQSRIAEVALALAFAFDTTFIALVLSLIMGAWLTHRIRVEDESIDQVLRDLIENIQSSSITGHLSALSKSADGSKKNKTK